MARIYVSSTYSDLVTHRDAVNKTLLRMQHQDVAMEYYTANSNYPLDKCLNDVVSCELYIGIFALRYGYIPDGYDKAITEMEYRKAIEAGIPCLIFLLDMDKAAWIPSKIEYKAMEKIMALREELSRKHMCGFFTDEENLARLVAEAVRNWEVKSGRLGKEDGADWELYRHRVVEVHRWVPLSLISASEDDLSAQVPLTEVFIPQLATIGTPTYELSDAVLEQRRQDIEAELIDPKNFPEENDENITTVSLVPILEEVVTQPKQVILGGPGSGKSTLLIYIMLRLCGLEDVRNFNADISPSLLPFIIELRKYVLSKKNNFVEFLCTQVRERYAFEVEPDVLKQLFESENRALVLFDGLDEVFDPDERSRVIEQFKAFSLSFPNVFIIVTSRIVGYNRNDLELAQFKHYTLSDFTFQQISQFLPKWYKYYTLEGTEKDAQELVAHIAENPRLLELGSNPLLLTMMAVIYKSRDLPEQRWKLYELATELLLERWDVKGKNLKAALDVSISAEQKSEILQDVSMYMLKNGEFGKELNVIAHIPLIGILSKYLQTEYGLSKGTSRTVANAILDHLRERTYILAETGDKIYGFVHRTFMEFFAARNVLREFDLHQSDVGWIKQEIVKSYWQRDDWQEVLLLFVAMLGARQYPLDDIVLFVLDECPIEPLPLNLVFAARCLAEARRYKDTLLPSRILGELAQNIADLSLLNRPKPEITEFLDDLLNVFTDLAIFAPEAPPEILNTINKMVDNGNTKSKQIAWQMTFALKPKSERLNYAITSLDSGNQINQLGAIAVLQRGWSGKSHIADILIKSFQESRFSAVRQAALDALQMNWPRDKRLIDIIASSYSTENSSAIIVSAIKYLATEWKSESSIFHLIVQMCGSKKNIGRRYPHDNVHQVATESLLDGWYQEEWTFDALKEYALKNSDSLIRSVVIRTLSKAWLEKQEVFDLLIDIANQDSNELVRRIAILELCGFRTNRIYQKDYYNEVLRDLNAPDMPPLIKRSRWLEDPRLLLTLREVFESPNESVLVRSAALQGIGLLYFEHNTELDLISIALDINNPTIIRIIALLVAFSARYVDRPYPKNLLVTASRNYIFQIDGFERFRNYYGPSDIEIQRIIFTNTDNFIRSTAIRIFFELFPDFSFENPIIFDLLQPNEDPIIRITTIQSFCLFMNSVNLTEQSMESAINNLEVNHIFNRLIDMAFYETDIEIRTMLIEIFSNNINTSNYETNSVNTKHFSDGNQYITLLIANARRWRNHSQAFEKTIELLGDNFPRNVREIAIIALLRAWPDDVEIINIIKNNIIEDRGFLSNKTIYDFCLANNIIQ